MLFLDSRFVSDLGISMKVRFCYIGVLDMFWKFENCIVLGFWIGIGSSYGDMVLLVDGKKLE